MLNIDATDSETTSRTIYFSLLESQEFQPDALLPGESSTYLRRQLALSASMPGVLPLQFDELSGWIAGHVQAAGNTHRLYLAERSAGGGRRHFGNAAQGRQFLSASAPARLVAGASLYGVLERWDDPDFHPLIAHYLELLGNGVPEHNRALMYRDLLESSGSPAWRDLPDAAFTEGAVELALARESEYFLPELIGFNLARQQPHIGEQVARHELGELRFAANGYAADPDAAGGNSQSALHSLRGILQRVAEPEAFYRRVREGYGLYASVAALTLPVAEASSGETPAAAAPASVRQLHPATGQERRHGSGERAVIRHEFPPDEHAWEAIGSELELLEARLAASDSKEEAMGTLARLMSPQLQHTAAGLMATRIFSQIFRL